MITVCMGGTGREERERVPAEGLGERVRSTHGLVWVDVTDPSPQEFEEVARQFGYHPLAIEDALRRHERPKIDEYADYLFLVFYTMDLRSGRPVTQEISFFVGKRYVLTVHHGRLAVLEQTAARWAANGDRPEAQSVGFLVYAILDAIVDDYFPVVDGIADRIDDLEDEIFSGDGESTQEEIFQLKKDLLGVRRVIAPERDVLNVLIRRDSPVFDEAVTVYFQDVYDHLLRVTDSVDTYRDILSSALDANLSMVSYHLNDLVKRLTSFSIILMSVTLVAGIYGMNFVHMPELEWQFGYAYSLGLMVAIAGVLTAVFRKIDWL